MNPTEFLSFAGNIAARGSANAASCRSATSRAYYGAYHLAVNLLIEIGHDPGKVHGTVTRWLAVCKGDPNDAGKLLQDLGQERRQADYELSEPDPEMITKAKETYQLAMEIQRHLNQCNSAQVKAAMAQDIAAYKAKLPPT